MRGSRALILGAAVAVFALACGLIIGSGPLRNLVLGTADAQAESLRGQVSELESELAASRLEAQDLARYHEALEPALVAGRLQGRTVAVVWDVGVDEEQRSALLATLEDAGALVSATAALTDAWRDEDTSVFRAALADELMGEIHNPPAGASAQQLLQVAAVQALVPSAARPPSATEGPVDPDAPSGQSRVLRDVLERAELMAFTDRDIGMDGAEGPSGVVLVTHTGASEWVTWAVMFRTAGVATVATAVAPPERVLVAAAEADTSAATVSVVANTASAAGRSVVVLALEEQYAGGAGIYGDQNHSPFAPLP